jgi:predicted RNA binding protein YcfA (HicA-like mRNA interferase family)
VSNKRKDNMKYKELEKLLKKNGCYYTGEQLNGHPKWFSPVTKRTFKMSHHGSEEVPKGTLNAILKEAGLK